MNVLDFLRSVAESVDSFVAIEAGARRGYWAVKAARAFRSAHAGACSQAASQGFSEICVAGLTRHVDLFVYMCMVTCICICLCIYVYVYVYV